jgi:hypothetical protein
LEGFGLIGAIVLFSVIFFIMFGLMRGYGLPFRTALPLAFALFYIGLWAVSPNILHNMAEIFPPINAILLVIFFVSVVKVVLSFFHHTKSPIATGSIMAGQKLVKPDTTLIDKDIKAEEREAKAITHTTRPITKTVIKTVDDIHQCLNQLAKTIEASGGSINQPEAQQIQHLLQQITQKEQLLNQGLATIGKHIDAYQQHHKQDIQNLYSRLQQATGKKRREIEDEIKYQKRMLSTLSFMAKRENQLPQLWKSFNDLLQKAMQALEAKKIRECLNYIQHAQKDLHEMMKLHKEQKSLERYLAKLDHRLVKDLEREKKT